VARDLLHDVVRTGHVSAFVLHNDPLQMLHPDGKLDKAGDAG
jgi:hypothetical protein